RALDLVGRATGIWPIEMNTMVIAVPQGISRARVLHFNASVKIPHATEFEVLCREWRDGQPLGWDRLQRAGSGNSVWRNGERSAALEVISHLKLSAAWSALARADVGRALWLAREAIRMAPKNRDAWLMAARVIAFAGQRAIRISVK